MPKDETPYTFNESHNDDRELLLSHGYIPGELEPEDERQLIAELRDQIGDDEDSDRLSTDVPGDERDGND